MSEISEFIKSFSSDDLLSDLESHDKRETILEKVRDFYLQKLRRSGVEIDKIMAAKEKYGDLEYACCKCYGPLEGGLRSYCRACRNKYWANRRPPYSALSPEQKMKTNARAYVNAYQRRGKITKQPCSKCGNEKSEKHHPDYSKPLEIMWLCRKCHLEHHREENHAK